MSTSCALVLMAASVAAAGSERAAAAFVSNRPIFERHVDQLHIFRRIKSGEAAFSVPHQNAPTTLHSYSTNDGDGWSKAVQKVVGNLDKRLDIAEEKERKRRNAPNNRGGNSNIQFVSPLLDDGYPPAVAEYEQRGQMRPKPMLLYLPGFDGTNLAPFLQFPSLGEEFDVRAMRVEMDDRSTFEELKEAVVEYLLRECKGIDGQANGGLGVLYLMGESFGGILATEVALELNRPTYRDYIELRGMILVNPATSYLRSSLYERGPSVANSRPLPPILDEIQYAICLTTRLVPLFLDKGVAIRQLLGILSSKGLPSVVNTPQREAYMGRVAFDLPKRLKFMPKDTLKWRLEEWLEWGCGVFEDRLQMLQAARESPNMAAGDVDTYLLLKVSQELRALIVVGEYDLTLPSYDEARRLSSELFRNAYVHVVPGAGHASTCGGSLNLMRLVREAFPETSLYGSDNANNGMRAMEELDGLEPRYDGASIGLNPMLYWSSEYYRKWRRR